MMLTLKNRNIDQSKKVLKTNEVTLEGTRVLARFDLNGYYYEGIRSVFHALFCLFNDKDF
jgi:hypothetical protein